MLAAIARLASYDDITGIVRSATRQRDNVIDGDGTRCIAQLRTAIVTVTSLPFKLLSYIGSSVNAARAYFQCTASLMLSAALYPSTLCMAVSPAVFQESIMVFLRPFLIDFFSMFSLPIVPTVFTPGLNALRVICPVQFKITLVMFFSMLSAIGYSLLTVFSVIQLSAHPNLFFVSLTIGSSLFLVSLLIPPVFLTTLFPVSVVPLFIFLTQLFSMLRMVSLPSFAYLLFVGCSILLPSFSYLFFVESIISPFLFVYLIPMSFTILLIISALLFTVFLIVLSVLLTVSVIVDLALSLHATLAAWTETIFRLPLSGEKFRGGRKKLVTLCASLLRGIILWYHVHTVRLPFLSSRLGSVSSTRSGSTFLPLHYIIHRPVEQLQEVYV